MLGEHILPRGLYLYSKLVHRVKFYSQHSRVNYYIIIDCIRLVQHIDV